MSSTIRSPFLLCFSLLLAGLASPALAQTSDPSPVYVFSHLAGPPGGHGNADGVGAAARFWDPTGIAVDSGGNIFIADPGSGSIRRITPAGTVTTVLTAAEARQVIPGYIGNIWFRGVGVDAADNLFISETNGGLIFKRTPTGDLSHYTGKSGKIFPSTDGPLAQASFWDPSGLAFDAAGNLYVADPFNQIIRKITPQGQVSTYAGTAPAYGHPDGAGVDQRKMFPGSADGPALSAQFRLPTAVAADAAGNLYVADTENRTVRKVSAEGIVTTLAGKAGEDGSADGTGESARFSRVQGIAVDTAGNVYVADTDNSTIRKITPAGSVTTFAGSAGDRRSVDGAGGAARFVAPKGLFFDRPRNRLLVGDGSSLDNTLDHAGTIRQVTLDGIVTTLAGQAGAYGATDGKGEAARFTKPADVAVDASGNVFVADDLSHTIRRIAPDGTVTTLAGTPGVAGNRNGPGNTARFNRPVSLALDGSGNLIVADHGNHLIRKVAPDGTTSTIAGQAGVAGALDGSGTAASFHNPVSVALDAAGNIYVGDGDYFPAGGDPARQFGTIRKITPAGAVSTLAGSPLIVQAEQARSNLDGTGANARFGDPTGLTVAPDGNLYVADFIAGRIRKVTPQGVVTSLRLTDANGAEVTLRTPIGIACDKAGNLFVTHDNYNRAGPRDVRIFRITPAGVTSVVAGTIGVVGSNNGVSLDAQFNHPTSIEVDDAGTLYVADTDNHAIRKGMIGGAPVITNQPQNQTVAAGGSVQLSVAATGVPAPTYQWHFNGTPFQGATSATLGFTNARATDAGDYTVVVTNALGTVTSTKATLAVTAAPVPLPPQPAGGSGGGGAPSVWFLMVLAALRLLHRFRRLRSGRL